MPRTLAGRMEFLMDLYAPPVFNDDGEQIGRDESAGIISREQLLELLDHAASGSSGSTGE